MFSISSLVIIKECLEKFRYCASTLLLYYGNLKQNFSNTVFQTTRDYHFDQLRVVKNVVKLLENLFLA